APFICPPGSQPKSPELVGDFMNMVELCLYRYPVVNHDRSRSQQLISCSTVSPTHTHTYPFPQRHSDTHILTHVDTHTDKKSICALSPFLPQTHTHTHTHSFTHAHTQNLICYFI